MSDVSMGGGSPVEFGSVAPVSGEPPSGSVRRWVPLSGVLSIVLLFVAFATAGSAPNGKASVAHVVAFYGKHSTGQTLSGVFMSFGALLFLIFAATFAARFRRAPEALPGAFALCLVGAGVLVVGLAIYAGLSIALGDVVGHVDASVVQALNVLADDAVFVFLITVGTSAFLLGAAATVFSTTVLPRWLGWLAVVLAVVGMIPSHVLGGSLDHIGFVAFVGLGVWTLIVGCLLAARNRSVEVR